MLLSSAVLSAFPVPGGVVALAGSRSLPPAFFPLVARVCAALSACAPLAVGCASGADAAVLSWALSAGAVSRVSCFAAFGPGGAGAAGAASAVSLVSRFAAAGGAVAWWAGGAASVPLRARLAARTRAAVSAASAGLVVFLAGPPGPRSGSWLAARLAAGRSLPVVAVPLGFSGSVLPLLAPGGGWRSLGAGAWLWCPPPALF